MKFHEVLHILVSVVTISLAFTLFKQEIFDPNHFLLILTTVGLGFILHEMAHKYVAIHFGAHAEYRAWTTGLFLALALAFFTNGSLVFAAPGAVYIFGRVTKEQNGKISLAGPMANMVLAILFILLGAFAPALGELAATGAYVNVFLGAFNMLPFMPLDGAKIAAWNDKVWLYTFAAFGLLFLALLF